MKEREEEQKMGLFAVENLHEMIAVVERSVVRPNKCDMQQRGYR